MRIVDSRDEVWTPMGVRLRAARRAPGRWHWLFFPGGPGLGSESLAGLVAVAALPGTSWLVDLPGDGSNVDAPGAPPNPYAVWPHVLLEAVDAVPNPVPVGHSTGGEYLLSVPALEERIAGLVLVSSAPDAGWLPTYEAITRADPIPGYAEAAERYECDPSGTTLRDLAVASAPWNFGPQAVSEGRALLAQMPYNRDAAEWSAANFDTTYLAAWFPRHVPTLIISGRQDRIVDQSLWEDPDYRGDHIERVVVEDAGHWPWLERPDVVTAAFAGLVTRLT